VGALSLDRRVVTAVLGASTGASVEAYGTDGTETLVRSEKIPFNVEKGVPTWWPEGWLAKFLDRLQSFLEEGDILAVAGWGADLALVRDLIGIQRGNITGNVLPMNYRRLTPAVVHW
jgi:hypothetical protein